MKQGILGLHGRNTPSGSELYYVGQVPRGMILLGARGGPKTRKSVMYGPFARESNHVLMIKDYRKWYLS